MKSKNKVWIISLIMTGLLFLFANSCKKESTRPSSATDVDGNVYRAITIGSQTWMIENLKTTKYNDGTPIPNVTDPVAWSNLSTPAYCWFNNDAGTDGATYGALYNWYTVNTNKLCPTGWHAPSDAEWVILENYLISHGYNYDTTTTGDRDSNNGIAKAMASASGWNLYPETGAVGSTDYPTKRNATGFNALPGGYRLSDGSFLDIGNYGYWWTSSESDANDANSRFIYYVYSGVTRDSKNKKAGFSVRCILDN